MTLGFDKPCMVLKSTFTVKPWQEPACIPLACMYGCSHAHMLFVIEVVIVKSS